MAAKHANAVASAISFFSLISPGVLRRFQLSSCALLASSPLEGRKATVKRWFVPLLKNHEVPLGRPAFVSGAKYGDLGALTGHFFCVPSGRRGQNFR